MTEIDKYYEEYKNEFCQKFTPWLKKQWAENSLFNCWFNLDAYLSEQTHGLKHAADVRTTASRITNEYLNPITEPVDENLLDMMALFHDIARQVHYPINREDIIINKNGLTKKMQRTRRCIFPHELTGAAFARIVCTNDPYFASLTRRHGLKVFRQLLSHDYHSSEVTPYCKTPATLEIQVISVADKTSINPTEEVVRRVKYLTTRQDSPVPFFDPTFPLENRRAWEFTQPAVDALCAIVPIFSYNPNFSTSEGLKKYYQDWSINLKAAIGVTLSLAQQIGGEEMKISVTNTLATLNIN